MKKIIAISFLAAIACAPSPSFGQSPSPAESGSASAAVAAPSVQLAPRKPGGMLNLSPEERAALTAATEKARQDPAVQAASAAMQSARQAYMKAMHDAVIAADPSVEAILSKFPNGGMGMGATGIHRASPAPSVSGSASPK